MNATRIVNAHLAHLMNEVSGLNGHQTWDSAVLLGKAVSQRLQFDR